MTATLESRIEELLRTMQEQDRLLVRQLAKSRAARATSTGQPLAASEGEADAAAASPAPAPVPAAPAAAPPAPTASPAAVPPSPVRLSAPSSPSASATPDRASSPTAASPSASPRRNVVPTTATRKEGTLLHLVRSSGLFGGGSASFVLHYIVVAGSAGIVWYASEAEYRQNPRRPLGHANFWIETYNSRGSRFKKAAVCWPLILPGDCPEAKDTSKTYFAVDYYTPNGAREQLVLAAASPAERDEWVQLLTKYIDLYLAPRAESQELQYIPRGAAVPLHRSGVIDGEAPGGNVL